MKTGGSISNMDKTVKY